MYKRILVPVDASETSNRALAAAIEMAQAFNARLRLLHVVEVSSYLAGIDMYGAYSGEVIAAMTRAGEKTVADGLRIAQAAGVEADCMVHDKFGALGESVATAAKLWDADLVVVGSHGRRGIGRVLMGSGAEQIVRLSPVPVLVIRAASASDDAQPPARP
ncbi:MAG: universal stress protein [Pseudomonadota bacterium]